MRMLYKKYERHITTIAFIVGFVVDNLTLQRIDRWFEHVVLITYASLAALLIVWFNMVDVDRPRETAMGRGFLRIASFFPVVIQLLFGALFSGSLVFYSRSASLSVSWPFLILLIGFMVGNEFVRTRYGRLTFQISGFFVATFLYLSYALPTVTKHINTIVFISAGLLSLFAVYMLMRIIRRVAPEKYSGSRLGALVSIVFLYGSFNMLYFTGLVPPLPLSLKEIGLYHSVERTTAGEYRLLYEPARWYEFRRISPVFHTMHGDTAYVYSAIFAPTKISTDIVHEWFYRDSATGVWKSTGTISFPITGGRDGGYRGYTSKPVYQGEWRVEVKTQRGARIGRTSFTVSGAPEAREPLETLSR